MNEDKIRALKIEMQMFIGLKPDGNCTFDELMNHAFKNKMAEFFNVRFASSLASIIDADTAPPEPEIPERFCDLTAEEWQAVIDGGYLCGFRDAGKWRNFAAPLSNVNFSLRESAFRSVNGYCYYECRPYRAVGHVQPYFDNNECKNYIAKLNADTSILHHNKDADCWHAEIPRGKCGVDWVGVDKFIVLSK